MTVTPKLLTEQWQLEEFTRLWATTYSEIAEAHKHLLTVIPEETWRAFGRKPLAYNTLREYVNDPATIPDDDIVYHAFECLLGDKFVAIAERRPYVPFDADRAWVRRAFAQLTNAFLHLSADDQWRLVTDAQTAAIWKDDDEDHTRACEAIRDELDSFICPIDPDLAALLGDEAVTSMRAENRRSLDYYELRRAHEMPRLKDYRAAFAGEEVRVEDVMDL